MNLETSKYIVKSDKYQFILFEKGTKKESVKDDEGNVTGRVCTGIQTETKLGFFPKFSQLVEFAIRKELDSDDVKTLEQILAAIESVKSEFANVAK